MSFVFCFFILVNKKLCIMANLGVNCRLKVSSPTFFVGSGTFTFVSYKLTHSPQFYKLCITAN